MQWFFNRGVLLIFVTMTLWSSSISAQELPKDVPDTAQVTHLRIHPLPILFYTPETGIAGGGAVLMVHRPETDDTTARPSAYALDFIYTAKTQAIAEISADTYLGRGTYRLVEFVHFSRYPQKFFGVGNQTPDSLEEDFTSRTFRFSLDALRKIAGAVSAGPSFFYEDRALSDLKQDGMLQSGTIPGSQGGRTLGIGGAIQWDTRDNMFTPSAGWFCLTSFRTAVPGSDFRFSNLTLDGRRYFAVGEASTIALQTLAMLTSGTSPFYLLPRLGGQNIMRGYLEGRYRDKNLLVVQSEYRFPLVWRFRGALFAGIGDVAPRLDRFTLDAIKPSYGFGLRYTIDPVEKICIRFDFGFGRGTSGFYFTANEAI